MQLETKIGNITIKSDNKDQTDKLIQSIMLQPINRSNQKIVLINKNDPSKRFELDLDFNGKYYLFFQVDSEFNFLCDIDKSKSLKLIEKATSNYEEIKREKRLIATEKARKVRNENMKAKAVFIEEFEKHISENIFKKLKYILNKIDANRMSYKCEIYENIFKRGYPTDEQWMKIINYFIDNILSSDIYKTMTFFELRKSFVSIISKVLVITTQIGQEENIRSIVKLSRKNNTEDYWKEYSK